MNIDLENDITSIAYLLYSIETEDSELDLLRREIIISLGDKFSAYREQEIEIEADEDSVQVEEVFKIVDKDESENMP